MLDLYFMAGISFPISWSMGVSLSYLSVYVSEPQSCPSFQYNTLHRSRVRSFCRAMRMMHIDQLPHISCQEHSLAMRDLHTLLELILVCLFSMWVKALFHLMLSVDCVVFSWWLSYQGAVDKSIWTSISSG